MSRKQMGFLTYERVAELLDLEAILEGQFHRYILEGRGVKAGRLLARIRSRIRFVREGRDNCKRKAHRS